MNIKTASLRRYRDEICGLLRAYKPDHYPAGTPGRKGGQFKPKGVAGSGPAKKWKKTAKDITDEAKARTKWGMLSQEAEDAIVDVYTVKAGDLSTRKINVRISGDGTTVIDGDIANADGKSVGEFKRTIEPQPDGTLNVRHNLLDLHPDVQGQGFAQAFNRRAFDWYRESGVAKVKMTANSDVGGYAWMAAGWDFEDFDSLAEVRQNMYDLELGGGDIDLVPEDRQAEQRNLLAKLRARMKRNLFGTDDFPTGVEISQLGRWPGAGKDDWWIGKVAAMGTKWNAEVDP